jgi:P pilus assembly protein, porin PapC
VSILLSFSVKAQREENDSEFESVFLRKNKNGATPDIFLYKNTIAPGIKRVEVVVNDRVADSYDVNFVAVARSNEVVPCFSQRLLRDAGIRTELYDGWQTSLTESEFSASDAGAIVCDNPEQRIPAARVFYNDAHQQLRLTVPQEAVNSLRFQMISPGEWDDGTPTLRTTYNGYFIIPVRERWTGTLTTVPSSASTAQPALDHGDSTVSILLTKCRSGLAEQP